MNRIEVETLNPKTMMAAVLTSSLAALFLLLLFSGCDHTHLSASYGTSYRSAFAKQVIEPQAGAHAKPEQELDPEEASIVVDTYRHSLAPNREDRGSPRTPVLVLPAAPPGGMPVPPEGR